MIQDVICNGNECREFDGKKEFFENLFGDSNIVYGIEKDLWRNNFYGN